MSKPRRIADWFIPNSIKQNPVTGHVELENNYERAMIMILIFFISYSSIIASHLYYYSFVTPDKETFVTMSFGLSVVAYTTAILICKLLNSSIIFLGNAYCFATFLSLIGTITITGLSWGSPHLPTVLFIPALAFLICGQRSGVAWSLIILLLFLLIWWVHPLKAPLPQIYPPEMLNQARLTGWVGAALLVAVCINAYQVNYKNLSERLAKERSHYAYQAEHDPLTGLANRKLFFRRANSAIDVAVEEHIKAAIVYIDLNDFKEVNDNFGHQAGDEVLIQKARQLKSAVRSSDTVARLGGDEFGIVFHAINNEPIERLMKKLTDTMNQAIVIDGNPLVVGSSIGVALVPDHGTDFDELMQHADSDMYTVKQAYKEEESALS
ncbi:hypothetical protein BST96_17150 [Oceanicoccus sagamiensis]|uniref:GGDEF domain-containing protein n=2 Tax=Oceanicoccus sagamiensis TaxID=716816 RepID=A0A1X9NET5_9GAMM|nr:hypothetical protein BST96_17150 [Oceanicoccus sagamiensis]